MPINITEKHIYIQARDIGLFAPESFRMRNLSKEKGISAIMGKLKSNPDGPMTVQTYLFDAPKWTLDKTRQWVDEHKAAPCRIDCPQICQAATAPIGRAIGLAVKGEDEGILLPVTASIIPGKGEVIITGQLREVMEESARVASSLLKARVGQDMSRYDFHVHIPPGSLAKDGPSAGLAIFLALKSAWEKQPLPQHIAVTGEIDLNGNVRRVGGIPAKVEAAFMAGLAGVIIPKENVLDIPTNVSIQAHLVETVDDAIKIIADFKFQNPKAKEADMDRLVLIKAAGLEETASDEAILTGIRTMKQSLDEKEKLLTSAPKAETVKALEAKVSGMEAMVKEKESTILSLKAAEAKRQTDDLVARALAEGKITPAQRPWAEGQAEKDPKAFEEFIKTAPVVAPLDRLETGKAPRKTDPGPTGKNVDPEVLARHERALAYQAKHKTPYQEALLAVA